MKRAWLAPLLPILLAVSGCHSAGVPSGGGKEPPRLTQSSNVFDPGRLAVGDTLLGLRVSAIEVHPSRVDSGGWTGGVRFEGPIELTGEYRPHNDYPEPPELCFFPDSVSAARLPRFPNDQRYAWFCFTNADTARQWLGAPPARRAARVVVDQYRYFYSHTDVYNTARLVRVSSRVVLARLR